MVSLFHGIGPLSWAFSFHTVAKAVLCIRLLLLWHHSYMTLYTKTVGIMVVRCKVYIIHSMALEDLSPEGSDLRSVGRAVPEGIPSLCHGFHRPTPRVQVPKHEV